MTVYIFTRNVEYMANIKKKVDTNCEFQIRVVTTTTALDWSSYSTTQKSISWGLLWWQQGMGELLGPARTQIIGHSHADVSSQKSTLQWTSKKSFSSKWKVWLREKVKKLVSRRRDRNGGGEEEWNFGGVSADTNRGKTIEVQTCWGEA